MLRRLRAALSQETSDCVYTTIPEPNENLEGKKTTPSMVAFNPKEEMLGRTPRNVGL